MSEDEPFECPALLGYDRGIPCARTTPHEPHRGCIYIATEALGHIVETEHPHLKY